jgi:hypothetical protein
MSRGWLGRATLSVAILGLLAFGSMRWLADRTGVEGWGTRTTPIANKGVTDAAIRERFTIRDGALDAKAYESAFLYLLEGYVNYRSARGARVDYPGTPSRNGRTSDGLEGYARFFPLAAAWLASGRADALEVAGRRVSVSAMLREGLLAGTDRDGPEFWGVITSGNQRLVESADVALGLWLSRETLWASLDPAQRQQVATWLKRALDVDAYAGNWSLFPVMVREVLEALGEDVCCNQIVVDRFYASFKKLAMGGGWIADGDQGADYYNAWAMQYVLFWLDQIDPAFDPQFIRQSNRELVGFYQHLMTAKGAPLFGRSICYRMATPVPLITAQVLSPGVVSPGRAMRALDLNWSYFVNHGALAHGIVTQGFCGPDLSVVNDYTAPGSCLWGTRALIVALYLDPKLKLFDAPREPLAVEVSDFSVSEPHIKWRAEGFKDRGELVLTLEANPADAPPAAFQPFSRSHAFREWLRHRTYRPDNREALYGRRQYSSNQTFTACTPGR